VSDQGKESQLIGCNATLLQIGDRVALSDSGVYATGVITEALESDYFRVQWNDCHVTTTHRRHALALESVNIT